MFRALLIFALCLFIHATTNAVARAEKASPLGKNVENFKLKDYRGKTWQLDDFKGSKVIVLAFVGTECPLVKLYGPRLAELAKQYEAKGVTFVGVNSNVHDSVTEIAAYARRHKIEFPILKDLGNKLADQLGAQRTPEVFVLDAKRAVRYHGRIDDQYGVGYIRDEATKFDLKNALDDLLAGKKVRQAETKIAGCIIGRVHQVKENSAVTYSKQIARILQNRCVECHRKGQIAPFALTKYEEVAGWAEMIAEVVDEGRMPPWHANPKFGHFSNDRRLSDSEKKLIQEWVKNGAPRGNAADLPKPKSYVEGWQLPRKPDKVFNLRSTPFRVPATGAVRYQYFIVNTEFKEDKWVQAAQILPDNRAVVHHVLGFAFGKNGRAELRELQGGAGGFMFGYVPGQREYTYPKGMAIRVPAGAQMVFQVHYTPIGTEQFDQSKLGLVFADPKDIKYEIKIRSAFNRFFMLRPKQDRQKITAYPARRLPDGALLLGMSPHMHLRGQAFRYEAELPDGKKEILLDVPNFDFNWQTFYRLTKPRSLPEGTRLLCTAWFDNSEDNLNNPDPTRFVRWGDQTWDEMMIGYYAYAVPRNAKAAQNNQPEPKKADTRFDAVSRIFRLLDKDGDGKVTRKEISRQYADRFDLLDRNRDGEITQEEMRQTLQGLFRRK